MNWYIKVLKQYADFNGRARRQEYWMFILFNIIISMVATALDAAVGSWGAITGLYGLIVLIPSLAVGVCTTLAKVVGCYWWHLFR